MATDLHQRLTDTILAQLETADPATWSPPWHGADPLPANALTGRRYRGLNVLALWCAAQVQGYAEARWATYRQWAALGAQVRKGERGTIVLFYKDLPREEAVDARSGEGQEPARGFVARASFVFNVAQVDGAPSLEATVPDADALAPLPAFAALVAASGARIVEGNHQPCYLPRTDAIHLPMRALFRSAEGHAGTLAHELVHWTGAPHRLARDLTGRFGMRAYAAEELVAELGAAFVLAEVGVARLPHPQHAAYVASWLPLLRADPRALASAAAQASRAAVYLVALGTAADDMIGQREPSANEAAVASSDLSAGAEPVSHVMERHAVWDRAA